MKIFQKIFKKYPVLLQIFSFAVIGVGNTLLDFIILNILLWTTQIFSGPWLFIFNVISFSIATTNSYYWNKRWTFKNKSKDKTPVLFSQFFIVSIIGAAINSTTVYLIATYTDPILGLSDGLWANVAKIIATALSLIWNFLGYKFIVFKK
jgi:putative flippase GtrA